MDRKELSEARIVFSPDFDTHDWLVRINDNEPIAGCWDENDAKAIASAINFTRAVIRSRIWRFELRDDEFYSEDQMALIQLAHQFEIVQQEPFDPEKHGGILYSEDHEPGDPIWTWSEPWKSLK